LRGIAENTTGVSAETTDASCRVFARKKCGRQFCVYRLRDVAICNGSTQPVTGTGYDFADFLLGFPQQTSLQSGATSYNFRANAFDFFAQDDWRFRSNLSFNLGLRYEYDGPYTEAENQIANLDVAPGFTAAVPVLPGHAGPFDGTFPGSLVRPDRNNFARASDCLETAEENGGEDRLRNQLQPGAIRHHDPELRVSTAFASTATNATDVNGLIGASPLKLTNGFPPPETP